MKILFSFFISIFFLTQYSYSQNHSGASCGGTNNGIPMPTLNERLNQLERRSLVLSTLSNSSNLNNAKGSPYLNSEFSKIILSSHKNKIFKARFNGYNGDMEVLDVTTDEIFVLNKGFKNYNVKFVDSDKTYSVFNFNDENNNSTDGFLVNLYDSEKFSLLKKECVQYLPERSATTSYGKTRKAQFKRSSDKFYIKFQDNLVQILPKNKKDIVKVFPEHTKNILAFIKENKIKTSKEADLIKLVSYINTL